MEELCADDFVAWTEGQAREFCALRVGPGNEIALFRNEFQCRLTPTIRRSLQASLDAHYQTAARLTTRGDEPSRLKRTRYG